jgi:hypothetical protein
MQTATEGTVLSPLATTAIDEQPITTTTNKEETTALIAIKTRLDKKLMGRAQMDARKIIRENAKAEREAIAARRRQATREWKAALKQLKAEHKEVGRQQKIDIEASDDIIARSHNDARTKAASMGILGVEIAVLDSRAQ